jgi:beta-N-acetylhexosaminidase
MVLLSQVVMIPGRVMKLSIAFVKLLAALALVPLAVDWRSPLLAAVRPWALMGLIGIPLSLILAEIRTLRSLHCGQRVLKVLGMLGLAAAILVLTSTLALEARFQWACYRVLHADPGRLERLGRHMIVGYHDVAEARELVRLRGIAGVFLSARNVRGKSVAEIRQEIRSFQDLRHEQGLPPLWVATDQEGGDVSRLSPPLTRLPALSKVVARCADMAQCQQAVRSLAGTQGRELAGIGVNLNFAPVVDINYHVVSPSDRFTRIFDRAISSDPEVVAQVAAWYCAGLEKAGVRCTLKHFPGLGRVIGDTHLSCAALPASVAELNETDWVPFRILMRQTGAFTMLGHVRLTAIDGRRPASASPAVIAGILRGEWKHDGVLITDDFSMHAVYRSSGGMDNGSITALNAGVDLILVSWDSDQYYRVMYALLNADEEGKLDRAVLQRSDGRLARAVRLIRALH